MEETVDEREECSEYDTGCNVAGDDSGSRNEILSHIYYYWIAKYLDNEIYHKKGTRWLCANGIPQGSNNGVIEKGSLTDEDIAALIQNNLVVKSGEDYKLNFACFTEGQFAEFISLFEINDEYLDELLTEWIIAVRKSFVKFVPARLDGQINQWVSTYLYQMIGYVVDELIRRGILKKPDLDKPLTDGVFYVAGKYINP